ncbi:SMI1/KNR4 family protein [Streptomyces sp. MBT42]|uniref:SMI1/KNR4 family protein n=1 Tax=unclassified Streptomyces TaxID=2593676 RepID=UPI001E329EB0|nr:SMI1/KNR4 family protein [Streptomyces sp. MBT42]MCD2469545.1 SMI1/KNR4 family protein [Streptomyces sp. MBT42]
MTVQNSSRFQNATPQLSEMLSVLGDTAGDDIDWAEASRVYGTSFPSDFREFMDRYGCGSIEDQLSVLAPRADESEPNAVSRFSRDSLDEADLYEGWESPEAAAAHPLGQMLIWGETVGADTLCWFTAEADPDRWPVAVFSRASLTWSLYPYGMSAFLLRVLRGDLDDSPLSDDSLSGWGEARFLNVKDELALAEADIHPWD